MKTIYLDNAATTAMSEMAVLSLTPFLRDMYGNPSSLHYLGQTAKEHLEGAREKIAKCINAQPKEIYFTSGGSEGDNQAIISAATNGLLKGKKHIITTAFEHHAVLHTLKKLAKQGFEITYLDVHENGIVTAKQVENAIREDTSLVTIMYANNEIGTIQPICEIGKICREKGVVFHTDAVQAVGHTPIDVVKDNVDLLTLSAHKFHGPKGVGALYCRANIRLNTLIEGGAQESRKRAGTENVGGIVSMAAALEENIENMSKNSEKMLKMREKLIDGLLKIPHSKLNGDRKMRLPSNVNMCFEGIEGEGLLLHLSARGICASSGSACTSGSLEPSHVLLALGLKHEVAHGSLRLSLSEYNDENDLDYVIKSVKEVVEYLRNMSPLWEELEKGEKPHLI